MILRFDLLYELLSLGNIAAGNLAEYLPFIFKEIESESKKQYLLLHSLKEVSS